MIAGSCLAGTGNGLDILMGYEFDFAAVLTDQYVGWLLSGIRITLLLTAGAWVLAFVLAVVLAVLRATNFRPSVWFVATFV